MEQGEAGRYHLLDGVKGPDDVKKLSIRQLPALAAELRACMMESVSKTGGHVASNLGVVELTIALHYVYHSPHDNIIWDVGHQSYVHKMLTGRKELMPTLRQAGGISGFPKTSESIHDIFETGHSSTSISAALGIARAMHLNGQSGQAIAIIGDGALTGGMAMEALNDAGICHSNLLVILNDNGMSISKNVGGLSQYLGKLRVKPGYMKTRNFFQNIANHMREGSWVRRGIHRLRHSIKSLTVPSMFFEDLGFRYFGPVDGHDINSLIDYLSHLKTLSGPLLLHVCTQKGKGYTPAEQNPDTFHGITPFEMTSGRVLKCSEGTWSDFFGAQLLKRAENNQKIVAVSAAMPDSTGLKMFRTRFPERFFDVGIAEQHAVTMAAGLAVGEMTPVVAIYSTFLQRAYDQILHDVCMQNLHVILAIDRAGIVGDDGETHQGVFDLSFLSAMPNMTILAPSSGQELNKMLDFAIMYDGPIAIRYPRGCADISAEALPIEWGKGLIMKAGTDVAIIPVGSLLSNAMEAADLLEAQGISVAVINPRFVKPIDIELVENIAKHVKQIVTFEDNTAIGGFGANLQQALSRAQVRVPVTVCGLPDRPITHGSRTDLLSQYGLDAQGMVAAVQRAMMTDKDIGVM